MSREATIRVSLQVKANDVDGVLDFQSTPTGYSENVTARKGPTPGAFTVSVYGTDVDLSQLDMPYCCWMMNQDKVNFITFGIKDYDTDRFYPLGELPPAGKPIYLPLSRYLLRALSGTGSGTSTPALMNTLHMLADTAACNVVVCAFEK